MTRDLPQSLPATILAAVERVIAKTDDIGQKRRTACATYRSAAFLRHANEARALAVSEDLLAKAQALIAWGVMVRQALPLRGWLINRFRTPGGRCQSLSVIRLERTLAKSEGFPGGQLTTELELELDEEEGLFRYRAWFDGFRVTGDAVLNTANSLYTTLHPDALGPIYRLVADGEVWRNIELGLDRLVEAYRDR